MSFVALHRTYGLKEIQSPLSMSPTVLPPLARCPWLTTETPEESSKCSAWRWRGLDDVLVVGGQRGLAAASAVGVLGVEDPEDVGVRVVAAVGAGLDGAGAAVGGGHRVAVAVVAEDDR